MSKPHNKQRLLTYVIVIILVLSISVGYSAFGGEMSISNVVGQVRVKSDIRVSSVVYSSNTANGMSTYDDYSINSIVVGVDLPNADSTVTYKVSMTNIGNVEMGVSDITGLPDNLTYSLSDYNLKQMICDDSNSCTNGIVKVFYITIGYAEGGFDALRTVYDLNILFEFKEFYMVTVEDELFNSPENVQLSSNMMIYGTSPIKGNTVNGIPVYIMAGDDLAFTFAVAIDKIPQKLSVYLDEIMISPTKYSYDNTTGTFLYANVNGDIRIGPPVMLYSVVKDATKGVDKTVKFSSTSTTSNGYGVNTLSGTEDDEFPIYYYRGTITDNNVNFGGFCWKMVRTTDTGGIKLVYNGTPSAGQCNRSGSSTGINYNYYNDFSNGLTAGGYMYGDIYSNSTITLGGKTWYDVAGLTTSSMTMTWYGIKGKTIRYLTGMATNSTAKKLYYYSKSITYDADTDMYTLVSPSQIKIVNGSGKNTLGGYYGCVSNVAKDFVKSCQIVDYMLKSYSACCFNDGETESIRLSKGETYTDLYDDFKTEEWVYGKNVSYDTETGMYTLQDTTVSVPYDWYTDRETLTSEGYLYTCHSINGTCTDVKYIVSTDSSTMNYVTFTNGDSHNNYYEFGTNAKYVYGKDVNYDTETGMYTLIDTMDSKLIDWDTDISTIEAEYRYTCLNETNVCENVNYVNYAVDGKMYYYTLTNGKKLDDIVDSINANVTSSIIKSSVDSWFSSKLKKYSSYIEDTVYCNDRGITNLAGLDANSRFGEISFNANNRLGSYIPSVDCALSDSFSVSTDIGNGKLTYPVGLLTADEVVLAGGVKGTNNTGHYLYTGSTYWLMSPLSYDNDALLVGFVTESGAISAKAPDASYIDIRPVISLKNGLYINAGNGTSSYPYVIE